MTVRGARVLAAAVAAVGLVGGCGDRPGRPNLLLITLDTTRADAFGAYGNPGGHTPAVDALAARGAVFERAVAPMGTTFPSHASLFTGRYPMRHGVLSNHDRLSDDLETLAERLGRAGWETAAWVSFESMLSRGGLRQGFATANATASGKPQGWPKKGPDVNAQAVPWLLRPRHRPFFVWIHYFEPHSPYEPTDHARERLAGYDGPIAGGLSVEAFYRLYYEAPLSAEEQSALRALYDGEVHAADRLVGEVLTAVESAGALDDTLVVVAADHGQNLGEHGVFGHAYSVWEDVIRVPLVMAGPGVPRGRRIPDRIGLVDVLPTLLELLGLEPADDVDGRSFVPALGGSPLPERRYLAEVQNRLGKGQIYDDRALAVYDGDRKSVWSRGRLQVFDLAADPTERRPVDRLDETTATDLETLASGYYEGSARGQPQEGDRDIEDELRALGYVE